MLFLKLKCINDILFILKSKKKLKMSYILKVLNFLKFRDFLVFFLNFHEFILNKNIKNGFLACTDVVDDVACALKCLRGATYVCAMWRTCGTRMVHALGVISH